MSDIILHHYEMSPYGEKMRRILTWKGLNWYSDVISMVLPRPDLMELTGGYRRTPVLQIGADIYCDTKAMAAVLDRRSPEPPLVPAAQKATVLGLSHWGETAFNRVVTLYFGLGAFPEEFLEDRQPMIPPGTDVSRAPHLVPSKILQLATHLGALEHQLEDGRPYLLGEAPTLADFSAYHPVFFLDRHPTAEELLERAPRVTAWKNRIVALQGGSRTEVDSADTVTQAKAATPAPLDSEPALLPEGLAIGQNVIVISEEYGSGNVSGQLVGCSIDTFTVRRQSERAGELHVHFPRDGYLLLAAR